ncbi:MAG: bifunctional acetaldehyde-CoA/alcohol dehydrogenase [Myxococcales bacterium]
MEDKSTQTNAQAAADTLVEEARLASAVFLQHDQAAIDRIVEAAAKAGLAKHIELARMAVDETGMGVFEDKVTKNIFATEYIYNDIRHEKTVGLIKDSPETGMLEYAEPLGVILGITPITNPTSTAMFKILISLKTRNPIIICASRNALKCTNEAARILYEAALEAGAPEYCVRWVENPSRELTHALMSHPGVSLILATGGMGLVQAAYGSGTPAIGVGPGNVPVFIEKSADVRMAVNDILLSQQFDNAMICASEQAIVVDREVQQLFDERMKSQGGYYLSPEEVVSLQDVVIDPAKQAMSSKVVGQSARKVAEMAGLTVPPGTRLLIAPLDGVGERYPLSREKLCPVLAYYVVDSFRAGVNLCTELTHFGGLGHTASIFSQDEAAIREFGETINTGRVVVNSPSALGGIGNIYNLLRPSLTLGCGTGGKNITTDNVTVTHLLNIKRVSKRMGNMKWFRVPPRIYFEPFSFDTFFQHEVRDLGVRRAFIVCSGSSVRSGLIERLRGYLSAAGIASSVFSEVLPDPTVEIVEAGVRLMKKESPDLIIAIGGGSPMDAAKAMWLLYERPELTFDDMKLRFVDIRKRVVRFPELGKKAKLIAIPTTSGTASEVTAFTVVVDHRTHAKYAIADYALTPSIAIIDPNLALSVPPTTTADTGLDAISHALESYVSLMASDFTDPLSLKTFQLVFEYLPRAVANGSDRVAREKLHNAATIAGLSFTNALLGANHALAHILGATFGIAHGRANALVMIPVIRFNAAMTGKFPLFPNVRYAKARERYAEIADALKLEAGTPEKGVESLIAAIAELKRKVGIPASIREVGVPEAEYMAKVRHMAEIAFDDQCLGANPIAPLVEELEQILKDAY